MYGMTPSYMDPKVRAVLMIIGLIIQIIAILIILWFALIFDQTILPILAGVTALRILPIIDSFVLVCSKRLSRKNVHIVSQVLGSMLIIIFFILYIYIVIILTILGTDIPLVFIAMFLVDGTSMVFCNICSYKIIQEIKEYDLIPQMNFPYYPSNLRFFNPVMEMRELPPQPNFMPKMLFPFMGNVQVPN